MIPKDSRSGLSKMATVVSLAILMTLASFVDSATISFTPKDNILIDCGANSLAQDNIQISSWLLPLHASDASFMTSKKLMGSHKSGFYSSALILGRYFSFPELQEATKSWDPNAVIGVGGFDNVYLGTLDNGTKVAVNHGSPQSKQGITEFQTEIQMLSKLRQRHLVSLIGYCVENSKMILVYEFMPNGGLHGHLFGKNLPTLSWKQRLEICIGSARGLHYLHTSTAQGIIHDSAQGT